MSRAKIFISYHKPYFLMKDYVFTPIHVGRVLYGMETKDGKIDKKEQKWLLKNLVGDNTGENISYKNRSYSELTAQYWAWKNYERIGHPEYVGFMHYRRHFEFIKPYKNFLKLNSKQRSKCINDAISGYDMIAPERIVLNNETNYEQYCNYEHTHKKDIDIMLDTLKEMYPEYSESADAYMKDNRAYFCNMYIMTKDVFFEYSNILFSVLEECEKRMDITNYDVEEKRVMGHLSERLFGIYVTKNREKYRIKEIPFILLEDADIQSKAEFYLNKVKILVRKLRPLI